jgi:hypothetical protein
MCSTCWMDAAGMWVHKERWVAPDAAAWRHHKLSSLGAQEHGLLMQASCYVGMCCGLPAMMRIPCLCIA